MGGVFPLWSMASIAAEGWEPVRDWICLSISLCFCVPRFWSFIVSYIPGDLYLRLGWNFNMICIRILAFLRRKKGTNRLTGWPRGPRARLPLVGAPPYLVAHSGIVSCWFRFPKFTYIPKKIFVRFYPIWTPFDMDFLQNKKHATNRNWHWALDQYVSPKK